MEATYFVTGATGNIGARLIVDILETDPEARILALVRGADDSAARTRLLHALQVAGLSGNLDSISGRLEVLPGDITQSSLGLADELYHAYAARVTHIVHAAATTQFMVPLACARQTNFVGTQHVAKFALLAHRLGSLKRFGHVSTAFIATPTPGVAVENDCSPRQEFDNSYEQTKYEAERYIRSLANDLPISIYRPSIVVGDSKTGRIISLNVLYTPLRYILKGIVRTLPCPPYITLDVVPVDYVAKAIHQLVRHPALPSGVVYNLTAGKSGCLSIQEIVGHAVAYHNFNHRHLPLSMISFAADPTTVPNRHVRRMLQAFMPYVTVQRQFDNSNTLAALRDTGITASKLKSYLDTLLDYCYFTGWGKTVREAA